MDYYQIFRVNLLHDNILVKQTDKMNLGCYLMNLNFFHVQDLYNSHKHTFYLFSQCSIFFH